MSEEEKEKEAVVVMKVVKPKFIADTSAFNYAVCHFFFKIFIFLFFRNLLNMKEIETQAERKVEIEKWIVTAAMNMKGGRKKEKSWVENI